MTIAPALAVAGALYPPTVTPPEQPLPLWRFLVACVRNPLRTLPRAVYETDKVVFEARPGKMLVWVSGPALVEQVLVSDAAKVVKSPVEKRSLKRALEGSVLISDGADWRWQRRAMAPLFRAADIESYVPAMAKAAAAQVEQWRLYPASRVRDIDTDMTAATYDVIQGTMLVGGSRDEAAEILSASHDYLARISWEMAYAWLGLPTWMPHPASRQMSGAARRLRAAVSILIARRRLEPDSPDDLLGRLLAARHPDTHQPMPDALVVSNLLTLLEAGHETTANALAWTLYLLARAPDWQDRVLAEVREAAGSGPIAAGHVSRLAVTQRVIKEAMRLYPPASLIAREVLHPLDLGGLAVPAGSQIVIPVYAIHRHRKLWRDPDRFDPDRFLPAAEAGRPRTQYMPFGGGPRVCIGAGFALLEATVLLATFVRAARFKWDGHHRPEPVSRITLRPAGGMPLVVSMR